jgi:hypothetical protein
MPVLESTDKMAPKSIVRHRPIGEKRPPAAGRSIVTTATTPVIQRASRPHLADVDAGDDVAEWQRKDEDDRTQRTQPATRHSSTASNSTSHISRSRPAPAKREVTWQAHPLFYLGIGMLAMLMLWVILSAATGWLTTTLDTMRYGYPRTFQTDAWVGHNAQTGQPSHFIAINLNRHIEVIELPGGDAAHAHIYIGPQLYSPHDDLVPVTLSFVDVNGDHKPDMLINFQGSRVVFINDGTGFRPLLPSERPQVEQFLQHLGQ